MGTLSNGASTLALQRDFKSLLSRWGQHMPSFKHTLPSSPLQPTSHEPVCLEISPRLTTFPMNSCRGCRRGISESRQGLSYWHHRFIPTCSTPLSPHHHNLTFLAKLSILSSPRSTAWQPSSHSLFLRAYLALVWKVWPKKRARLGFASKQGGVTPTLTLTQNCCDQLLFWTNGALGRKWDGEGERFYVMHAMSPIGCRDEVRTQSESFGTAQTIYGYSLLLSSINCLLGGRLSAFLGSWIMWCNDITAAHIFLPVI